MTPHQGQGQHSKRAELCLDPLPSKGPRTPPKRLIFWSARDGGARGFECLYYVKGCPLIPEHPPNVSFQCSSPQVQLLPPAHWAPGVPCPLVYSLILFLISARPLVWISTEEGLTQASSKNPEELYTLFSSWEQQSLLAA